MRIPSITLTTLALASAVFLPPAAHAGGTYNDGDLFLGFRSTSSSITNDFYLDIGQPDQFENLAPGTVVTIGNYNTDLTAVFGSSYYSSSTLYSIVGAANFGTTSGHDPMSTLFTTVPGTRSNLFPQQSDGAQSSAGSTIAALGNNNYQSTLLTSTEANGVIEPTATSYSYRSFQPGGANSGGISFGFFNPSNENSITTSSQFEELTAAGDGSTASGKSGAILLGTVSVSPTGVVTVTAVPEPGSSVLLAIGGALGLGLCRQRRLLA